MIAALAKIFGEAMDDIRLEGYLAALEDVPTDALKLGLQRAVRDAKFLPKASELHQWASWEWGPALARAMPARADLQHADAV